MKRFFRIHITAIPKRIFFILHLCFSFFLSSQNFPTQEIEKLTDNKGNKQNLEIGSFRDAKSLIDSSASIDKKGFIQLLGKTKIHLYEISYGMYFLGMRFLQEKDFENGIKYLKVSADIYLNPLAMSKLASIYSNDEKTIRETFPEAKWLKDRKTSYKYIVSAMALSNLIRKKNHSVAILNLIVNSALGLFDSFEKESENNKETLEAVRFTQENVYEYNRIYFNILLKKHEVPAEVKNLTEQQLEKLLLLPVRSGGLMGFVDTTGRVIIEPKFVNVGNFYEGFANFIHVFSDTSGKYKYGTGVINKKGDTIVKPIFERITSFEGGYAIGQSFERKLFFINKNGKVTDPKETSYHTKKPFSEGLAAFVNEKYMGKKPIIYKSGLKSVENVYEILWGYMDTSFKVIIPPAFEKAGNFKDGMAIVLKKGKYGAINKKGETLINFLYEEFLGFDEEGFAAVKIKGKWGFIGKNGKFIIQPAYDDVKRFSEGLTAVEQKGKWGYIDRRGKITIPVSFIKAYEFLNGRALCMEAGYGPNRLFLIDRTGKKITKNKYQDIGKFQNGVTYVRILNADSPYTHILSRYSGLIDTSGKEIISPSYEYLGSYSEGLIAAAKNARDKSGYIDISGNEILKPEYDWAENFINGTARVKISTKTEMDLFTGKTEKNTRGFIDKTGKFIFETENELVKVTETIYMICDEDYKKKDGIPERGKIGYVTREGKIIWEAEE